MKVIEFQITRQCQHTAPCATPPDAEAITRWRSTQTVAAVPPARWTLKLLEQFVTALCAQAGITDLTLVEFRGDVDEPGMVSVSGNSHHLAMALDFVPEAILGPWLLAQRASGSVWSVVYRPQPRDAYGAVLSPG